MIYITFNNSKTFIQILIFFFIDQNVKLEITYRQIYYSFNVSFIRQNSDWKIKKK